MEERVKMILRFQVSGMSCAACSARVEKAVSAVEGVDNTAVNLLTGDLRVEGSVSSEAVIRAVTEAGYGCTAVGKDGKQKREETDPGEIHRKTEVDLRRRLFISAGFVCVLMYLSMGIPRGLPAPAVLRESPAAAALAELLLSSAVLIINRHFFIHGFSGLLHRAPNMDTLVSLGSSASWLCSTWYLFRMLALCRPGQDMDMVLETSRTLLSGLYYESAAMILVLITVGKMLEARSKGKTTDAVRSLMKLKPAEAVLLRNGTEVRVPAAEVMPGDLFILRPGDSVPADGVVLEGISAVDESALTGESIPVEKFPQGQAAAVPESARVRAATINRTGYLKCRAEQVGEDTAFAKIIALVNEASATKAPIARLADRVSGIFVPAVMIAALITAAGWLLCGSSFPYALERGIAVLVVSCPCALGLATPVAVMVGNGVGARNGILFKTSEALELTGKIRTAAFDKTGTVTTGHPEVTDVLPAEGIPERKLLEAAVSVEQHSEHPIAEAVRSFCEKMKVSPLPVTEFEATGSSVSAVLNGAEIAAGSRETAELSGCPSGELTALDEQVSALCGEGKTPVWFSMDGVFLGVLFCEDEIRGASAAAMTELSELGVETVLISGDSQRTAEAAGRKAGIDRVYAGVLPGGKAELVRKLQETAPVLMTGDGINDAPALKAAAVGIAVGAGTDAAMDAADVVLMKSDLRDVAAAVRLSRLVIRNIRQNLFWAFFYNILCIPLAAGLFSRPFGLEMSPMLGAAAMSVSSLFVVSNALRLNFARIYPKERKRASEDHKNSEESRTSGECSSSEESTKPVETEVLNGGSGPVLNMSDPTMPESGGEKMTEILNVEGMMCPHCEARVKKALEAVPGVISAEVSHEKGTAVISGTAGRSELVKAVTEAGYEVK